MSLAHFSLRHSAVLHLVFLGLGLVGLATIGRLPLEVYPDVELDVSVITTAWPGGSPEDVERFVTTPIEDEIERTPGIKRITSSSQADGSIVTVEWEETLADAAHQRGLDDVRGALERLDDLPPGARRPQLVALSTSEFLPVCLVALVDRDGAGEAVLFDAAKRLRERIEALPSVRSAKPQGLLERELHVDVERDRAHAYDLTLAEIAASIGLDNQTHPAGTLSGVASRELRVRGVGELATTEALADTVLRTSADGISVRVSDVASVTSGFERATRRARFEGRPAVLFAIAKSEGSDVALLVQRVRELLDAERPALPAGLDVALTWDTSRHVVDRLSMLESSLYAGVLSIAAVLWIALGWRNAVVELVGIPFAFLTTIALLPLLGMTLNALSLIGLLMASGMLVDDSILLLDHIQRGIDEGRTPRDAVIHALGELAGPVVVGVGTTIAAFVPLLFVEGMAGEFMAILPKTVILCLAASLAQGLLVLPLHVLEMHHATERLAPFLAPLASLGRALAPLRRAGDGLARAAGALHGRWTSAQGVITAYPFSFLVATLGLLVLASGVATRLPVDLFPGEFEGFFVSVETPAGRGLGGAEAALRELEALLDAETVTREHASVAGLGITADSLPVDAENRGLLYVSLPRRGVGENEPARVIERVRARADALARARPDAVESVLVMPPRDGPPVGKPVAVRVQAADYADAARVAAALRHEIERLPGVYNVHDNLPSGPDELRVRLDGYRASLHGVRFEDVGTALRAANDGLVASTYRDLGSDEDVDLRVRLRGEDRVRPVDLLRTSLRAPSGERLELGEVARLELAPGPLSLPHWGGRRGVVVYADVDGRAATSRSVNERVAERFEALRAAHPGVDLILGGEYEMTQETVGAVERALGVALLAIYVLLTLQFGSALQPLLVMTSIPIAFAGVVFGIWLLGDPISVYVLYAIVALAGVVVNEAIVLVDFANDERERTGAGAEEAIARASAQRLRPVVITSVTTLVGALPMALGLSGQSATFGPFAAAIVSGVSFALGLSLFVVAAAYVALDRAREAGRRVAGAWGAARAPQAALQPRRIPSAWSTTAPPSHEPNARLT